MNTTIHTSGLDAIDMIDAALFTGDTFHDLNNISYLKDVLTRWNKQLKSNIDNVTFVTFGTDHRCKKNGIYFDENCIAVITGLDMTAGRAKAMEIFGTAFCTSYYGDQFNFDNMHLFTRSFITVHSED